MQAMRRLVAKKITAFLLSKETPEFAVLYIGPVPGRVYYTVSNADIFLLDVLTSYDATCLTWYCLDSSRH